MSVMRLIISDAMSSKEAPSVMILPALISISSSIRLKVSGFEHTFMTGDMAEPATEPRPVVYSIMWHPDAIISIISALSLILGKPHRGSPSGTTSIIYSPPQRGGRSAGVMSFCIVPEPLLQYEPSDFSSIVVSPPTAFPCEKLSCPMAL